MAWLIALALVFAVGGALARHADKKTDKQFRKGEKNLEKLDPFLANFYVVRWYFYQQMESQALEQWTNKVQKKNLKPSDDPEFYREEDDPHRLPNRDRWCKFQEQVFGLTCDEKSAQVAYAQMMKHGCKMLAPNPDLQQRKLHGFEYVDYKKDMSVDPDEAGTYISTWAYSKMPIIQDYFDFKFAANATDPWAISLMPEIDDYGVAHYRVGRYEYLRHGTPSDYEGRVKQVRQQSKKQLQPYKRQKHQQQSFYYTTT